MKNKFLLLIALVLVSIFSSAQHVQAISIDENGNRWWTIEELLQIKKEMNEIIERNCDDNDNGCIKNQISELSSSDKKYKTASRLSERTLLITDINPSKNTIKVLFNSEDYMLKRMTGRSEKYDLEKLIIAWKGEGITDNFTDVIWQGKELTGWYQVYNFSGGETNIKDNGMEIEIASLPTANLIENKSGLLDYYIVTGGSNAIGAFNYSACLNSPNYKEGMSCRAIMSEKSRIIFEPYEPQEAKETKSEETHEVGSGSANEYLILSEWHKDEQNYIQPTKNQTSNSSNDPIANTNNVTNDKNEAGSAESIAKNENLTEYDANNIKIPNSGNQEKSFPWWVLVLIFSCTGILIWLFWPKRKKIQKKS